MRQGHSVNNCNFTTMVINFLLLLLFYSTFVECFLVPDGLQVVNTRFGEFHGMQENVQFDGKKYVVGKFLGIPYAKPPVGDLRFRKPLPFYDYQDPFKAFAYGPSCPQRGTLTTKPSAQSEDCLTLNVFVPNSFGAGIVRKPVMIWIHGGGFVTGWSGSYPTDVLSAFADVIVVTINYRLGPLGFFTTLNDAAPGNFGLWDQHLAIEWVYDNIESFGGDSYNITIFGESAGSSSVIFQTLYARNRGLFKRAIAESGTVSAWALSDNDSVYANSMSFAESAGCTDRASVVPCMTRKSSAELETAVRAYSNNSDINPSWIPVFDRDFVVEEPSTMLNNALNGSPLYANFRELDLMIGWNNYDGSVYLPFWMSMYNMTELNDYSITEIQLKQLIPRITEVSLVDKPTNASLQRVIDEYIGMSNQANSTELLQTLSDIATDAYLAAPSIKTADAHFSNSTSTTYVYRFSAKPPYRLVELPPYLDHEDSANHADELLFVLGMKPLFTDLYFDDPSQVPQPTPQQIQLSKAMMTLWSNFAKSGNPNKPVNVNPLYDIEWQQYTTDQPEFLEITTHMTNGSIVDGSANRVWNFWNNVLPNVQKAAKN